MPKQDLSKDVHAPLKRSLIRYGVLAVIYLLLILLLPANPNVVQAHNLSSAEYHVLQLLIGLPLLAVWFVGFYGYAKLEEYAASIRNTAEATGFRQLALGCAWIAWSLPVHSIVVHITRGITYHHPSFASASVIIINYVDLLFPLVAFSLIGLGSKHLFDRAKITLSSASIRAITLLFVAGGVFYCYLVFRQFSDATLGSTDNPYYSPVWLVVLTLIIPYLYAWFVGMLAVYELVTYGRKVRGVLYRQAIHLLVIGVFAMILGSIAAQYARSIEPTPGHLILNGRLVLAITFQVITGIGFVIIAVGASRLRKIEEV